MGKKVYPDYWRVAEVEDLLGAILFNSPSIGQINIVERIVRGLSATNPDFAKTMKPKIEDAKVRANNAENKLADWHEVMGEPVTNEVAAARNRLKVGKNG